MTVSALEKGGAIVELVAAPVAPTISPHWYKSFYFGCVIIDSDGSR